jgi:hypothetical protein
LDQNLIVIYYEFNNNLKVALIFEMTRREKGEFLALHKSRVNLITIAF